MSQSTEQLLARSLELQRRSRVVRAELNQLTASIIRLRDQMLAHERRMLDYAARTARAVEAAEE